MTITQHVAALHVDHIAIYADTDPSEQFEVARDWALEWGFETMDHYDAVEIALDDRALELGLM